MIEIQLEYEGPWIPLIRAMTSFDLDLHVAERILTSGVWGIRILFGPVYLGSHSVSFEARRVSPTSKQYLWRSASMAAPAFADLPVSRA